jgi:uncharacterized RDD family membrane protein YckC
MTGADRGNLMSSSMPEQHTPGQWGGTQESARPGEWTATAGQRAAPGQEQFGSVPPGGGSGQSGAEYPGQPYGGRSWGSEPGAGSPVDRDETRVVGRRVVQYIIDYILVGIIPGIAYWLLDRGSGVLHGFGWTIATLIAIVVYLWYWVLRPQSHHGQTFGMQWLGVRIISKDGGPANMLQLLVRGVLLIIDTLFFGLVGLITMVASRYHQRVGDHAARTLVVATGHGFGVMGSGRQFERTGTARPEDERLATPDMYAEDRYVQDPNAADPNAQDLGSSGPGHAQGERR